MAKKDKHEDAETPLAEQPMRAHAQAVGLSFDDVKKGLKKFVPIMELIATSTPNKYDDAAVAFLKSLLAE